MFSQAEHMQTIQPTSHPQEYLFPPPTSAPITAGMTAAAATTSMAGYPSLLGPSISVPSPRLEFRAPKFAEFSEHPVQRALVDHFCNVLSHLIVFREEDGNPFQQLVLRMAHLNSTVKDSLYALSCAHMEHRGSAGGDMSMKYHQRAIQGLAQMIKIGSGANQNELLATIMMLVYYEAVRISLTVLLLLDYLSTVY